MRAGTGTLYSSSQAPPWTALVNATTTGVSGVVTVPEPAFSYVRKQDKMFSNLIATNDRPCSC